MRVIITILILLITIGSVKKPNGCLQMDIMLLGDFSSSINGYESFVSGAFKSFSKKFELDERGVKIGIVTFNDYADLICPLTSDQELLKNKADSLKYYRGKGNTNMYSALDLAVDQFARNGRPAFRKIIIVVSDGEPDYYISVLNLATQIKSLNIGICGVLIIKHQKVEDDDGGYSIWTIPTYNRDKGSKFMKQLSSEYCYVESDYENLIKELKKLDICL